MFDQKDVEAYRRIKAPEELREQVMRLEQKPEPTRTRTKWISFGSLAAAACAAVLFIAALPPFAVRGETALLYQGVPIGAEPVSIPADHPQMTSGLREVSGGIPLALETGETTGYLFPAVNSACLIRRANSSETAPKQRSPKTFCSTGTSPAQRTPCFP